MLMFQWRYCIRIENIGQETVQLRERQWRIFSLSGTLETVRGRGVVGQVSTMRLYRTFVLPFGFVSELPKAVCDECPITFKKQLFYLASTIDLT